MRYKHYKDEGNVCEDCGRAFIAPCTILCDECAKEYRVRGDIPVEVRPLTADPLMRNLEFGCYLRDTRPQRDIHG